jgi:hypothetical protein
MRNRPTASLLWQALREPRPLKRTAREYTAASTDDASDIAIAIYIDKGIVSLTAPECQLLTITEPQPASVIDALIGIGATE